MSSHNTLNGSLQYGRSFGDRPGPELPFADPNNREPTAVGATIPSPINECLFRIVRLCEKTYYAVIPRLLRTSKEVPKPIVYDSQDEKQVADSYRATQLMERYHRFRVAYGDQLKKANNALKNHGTDEIYQYLADFSTQRIWSTEFSWLAEDLADVAQETRGWTRVSGVEIVTVLEWVKTAVDLKHQFTLLQALERRFLYEIPQDAKIGITDRLDLLTSFAKAVEVVLRSARNPNYIGLV
ncbi:hypothetical protein K440DRAFT_686641 [Wilcoxina mikolae CBS 423.85]|nr:hypothetical protein K440DRAFT_686641 [Wilcoxina mikolae CBS 423.85]